MTVSAESAEREERRFPYMTLLSIFGIGWEWCSERGRLEKLDYGKMIVEWRTLEGRLGSTPTTPT